MSERAWVPVLLVLGALLAGFTILQGTAPHDEGLMLQAGSRIASGQLPYRDFWTNYMPWQPLVLAGLQEVFGPSLLAWRILAVAEAAVVAVLAYLLALRLAPRSYALVAWLAVAGVMAFPLLPGPNPPSLLLAFAALLLAERRPLWAGVLAGVACGFRLEIGVAAAVGVVVLAPPGSRLRSAAVAVAAGVLVLAPFFIAAPGAMLHDTIGFYAIQDLQRLPLHVGYSGPIRPSKLIEFYIPIILLLALAVWAVAMVVARRTRERLQFALLPLALVGLSYLLGRTDEFHLVPLAAVLPIMLAGAAAQAPRPMAVALACGLGLIALYGLDRRAGQLLHPPALAAVPGPAGDGVETDPADARSLAALEAALRRVTRPGEAIFVANPRFDRVHAGDPLLYVIVGHPNATGYDVMQPGVVTTARVQREIVDSLGRAHTRIVVRWLDPRASEVERNGSGRSSGVHLLDRYLATHFRPLARYGYYELTERAS